MRRRRRALVEVRATGDGGRNLILQPVGRHEVGFGYGRDPVADLDPTPVGVGQSDLRRLWGRRGFTRQPRPPFLGSGPHPTPPKDGQKWIGQKLSQPFGSARLRGTDDGLACSLVQQPKGLRVRWLESSPLTFQNVKQTLKVSRAESGWGFGHFQISIAPSPSLFSGKPVDATPSQALNNQPPKQPPPLH